MIQVWVTLTWTKKIINLTKTSQNMCLKIKISKEYTEVKAQKKALCQLFIKLKTTNITAINSTINQ